MSKRRAIILLFFAGLCVVLVPYFFLQTRTTVPKLLSPIVGGMAKLLSLQGEVVVTPEGTKLISRMKSAEADPLSSTKVSELIAEYRDRFGYEELEENEALELVAEKLAAAIAENIDQYEDIPFETLIASYVHDSKSSLAAVGHISVVGPTESSVAFSAFVSDAEQSKMLLDTDAEVLAVATSSAQYQNTTAGIIVVMLAELLPEKSAQAAVSVPITKKITFPEISDNSMLAALNEYRRAHGIPQLIENQLLCQYAQKRVGDLVAYGGLDGHEGFRKDFEDLDNLPEPIKQYPGGKIGENLAYQHCRNMTTGDGFVAETATALIEWCFDSSTKGHREAQLNPKFTAACARHQNGLFAVIFGE